MQSIATALPIFSWLKHYNDQVFKKDFLAAVIVTILLIPQALAYALLAGLPAEVGLYSTILPLIVYAFFGSSRTLSVAPMAIASLMTAVALAEVAKQGSADYLSAAIVLAFLSGVFLLILGAFKFGFLANFLSYPVISGFITASAIIIALSQLKHLLGIEAHGINVFELSTSLFENLTQINPKTMLLGFGVVVFLYFSNKYGANTLQKLGIKKGPAQALSKAAPLLAVLATIMIVIQGGLESQGVAIVGEIEVGVPVLALPVFSLELIKVLIMPAILISVIGYVESVSIAKKLAAIRREKIDVNQELVGLGAANIASSLSGGFPVAGSLSRTTLNFNSGAMTQAASIYAAILVTVASFTLTPILYFLPKATLAATIMIAVISLVDFSVFKKTWNYARGDFYAILITLIATLFFGVELGLICGVATSIFLLLYRSSKPHVAEVGLMAGTQHFKNVRRHEVETTPEILSLRVDESLFFANASFLEDRLFHFLNKRREINSVIFMCSAVNEIDYSALEILDGINIRLINLGMKLHLSEVKGPVMDTLKNTSFIKNLSGDVFLCQYDAYVELKYRVKAKG
ncbi:MAG: sulfate permease [Bermanella sp.]